MNDNIVDSFSVTQIQCICEVAIIIINVFVYKLIN